MTMRSAACISARPPVSRDSLMAWKPQRSPASVATPSSVWYVQRMSWRKLPLDRTPWETVLARRSSEE